MLNIAQRFLGNIFRIFMKYQVEFSLNTFFYKQHFFKQHPEAELLLFANYSHYSSTLLSKNNSTYLKNKQKNKCVCIYEIIRLIIMKMKMKMKNRSNRYDINSPRPGHEHKYSKYKKCLSMMML